MTYLTHESLASRVWDAFATRKDLLFYGWQPSEGQTDLSSVTRFRRGAGQAWNIMKQLNRSACNTVEKQPCGMCTECTESGQGKCRGLSEVSLASRMTTSSLFHFLQKEAAATRPTVLFPLAIWASWIQLEWSRACGYIYCNICMYIYICNVHDIENYIERYAVLKHHDVEKVCSKEYIPASRFEYFENLEDVDVAICSSSICLKMRNTALPRLQFATWCDPESGLARTTSKSWCCSVCYSVQPSRGWARMGIRCEFGKWKLESPLISNNLQHGSSIQ